MRRQSLNYDIRLARAGDARPIAGMSRRSIEQGLGWRWTETRVLSCIRHPAINVVVAREGSVLAGFGIMEYGEDEAHLLLFAVHRRRRREGVGAALMRWLEATALTAGIGLVRLEARADNPGARSFYRSLGYRETGTIRGFYLGREDAVSIAKDLWAGCGDLPEPPGAWGSGP